MTCPIFVEKRKAPIQSAALFKSTLKGQMKEWSRVKKCEE